MSTALQDTIEALQGKLVEQHDASVKVYADFKKLENALGKSPTEEDAAAFKVAQDEFLTASASLGKQIEATERDIAVAKAQQGHEQTTARLTAPPDRSKRICNPVGHGPGFDKPAPGNEAKGADETPDARNQYGASHERFLDDPMRGFKGPREFITGVMRVGANCIEANDPRLKSLIPPQIDATAGSDEHGVYDPSRGGFLVPEGMAPGLLSLRPEDDPTAGRTTMVPMDTPVVKMPFRVDKNHSSSVSGGLTVSRRQETGTPTSSRTTLGSFGLTAYNLFGLSYVTEELLTDSPTSFAAILAAGFSDEFTSHMIDERLSGTGVGQHLGVWNSPGTVTQAKETGQVLKTIVWQNILNMRARAWRYGDAIWLANHDTLPQLMEMVLPIGTGGVAVWNPSTGEDRPDLLLGRPIFFTESAETLGTVGDIGIYNWKEYLEGIYQPFQSAESIHVRFLEHERAFKFWIRNAGAPWWDAALTPKNSTTTLSPFVLLAARA